MFGQKPLGVDVGVDNAYVNDGDDDGVDEYPLTSSYIDINI